MELEPQESIIPQASPELYQEASVEESSSHTIEDEQQQEEEAEISPEYYG